jgi:hypothetical protein
MKNVKSNISFFIDEKIRSNSTIIFNTVGSKVFEQVNLKTVILVFQHQQES